jgi:hypothetical protein
MTETWKLAIMGGRKDLTCRAGQLGLQGTQLLPQLLLLSNKPILLSNKLILLSDEPIPPLLHVGNELSGLPGLSGRFNLRFLLLNFDSCSLIFASCSSILCSKRSRSPHSLSTCCCAIADEDHVSCPSFIAEFSLLALLSSAQAHFAPFSVHHHTKVSSGARVGVNVHLEYET